MNNVQKISRQVLILKKNFLHNYRNHLIDSLKIEIKKNCILIKNVQKGQ